MLKSSKVKYPKTLKEAVDILFEVISEEDKRWLTSKFRTKNELV
jgi:hypothetical protein